MTADEADRVIELRTDFPTRSYRVDDLAAELGVGIAEYYRLRREMPWIDDYSVRFAHAPVNIRAWFDAGRPAANRAALEITGDEPIVLTVRATLETLSEPIAWFIVNNVIVRCGSAALGGPALASGWCGPAPAGSSKMREIGLVVDDAPSFCHEAGHAIQRAPSMLASLSAEERGHYCDAIQAVAAFEDRTEEIIEREMVFERAADAFAGAMGHWIDTCSGWRGEHRRAGLRRDIAEARARFNANRDLNYAAIIRRAASNAIKE